MKRLKMLFWGYREKRLKIMSLGAWCRPAYQIQHFAKGRNTAIALKGPFDWTITSFDALRKCLDAGFDPMKILDQDRVVVSFAGSGKCVNTGLIFHHSIGPSSLKKFGSFTTGETVPETTLMRRIVDDARRRFIHTFNTLKGLRSGSDDVLFVRWRRSGHPDPQFWAAFDGEDDDAIISTIERFLGHSRFHVLSVESRVVEDMSGLIPDPIIEFRKNGRNIFCTMQERQGWNGDQTLDFRGDEHSWATVFDRTLSCLKEVPPNSEG